MSDNLFFYRKLTDQMKADAGIEADPYEFSFRHQDQELPLEAKGKSTVKIPDEVWSIDEDGLCIKRLVSVEYPQVLHGKNGLVPEGAEFGFCIYWTNSTHSTAGCILPVNEWGNSRKCYQFEHYFQPHTIKGDLRLDLAVYLKEKATELQLEEQSLANEEGLNLGTLDTIVLDFDNAFLTFPIVTVSDKNQPLWWVDIHPWDDPKTDLLTVDNVCLYLNEAYKSCPASGSELENVDILVEILTQVYYLLFKRIEIEGCLDSTLNDIELAPNSICKIMYLFSDDCKTYEPLNFDSPERLIKSINSNVRRILTEEDEE